MTGTTTEDVERLATELENCWGYNLHLASADASATLRALAAERDAATTEAINLARALHAHHYAEIAPNWEPLDYCAGVISQIDNMVEGIVADRDALAARVERLEGALRAIHDAPNDGTADWYELVEWMSKRARAALKEDSHD